MRAAHGLREPVRRAAIRCPFCGIDFDPEKARDSCAPCPVRRLSGACGRGLVRCPRCGYESPLPPSWLRRRVHGAA